MTNTAYFPHHTLLSGYCVNRPWICFGKLQNRHVQSTQFDSWTRFQAPFTVICFCQKTCHFSALMPSIHATFKTFKTKSYGNPSVSSNMEQCFILRGLKQKVFEVVLGWCSGLVSHKKQIR